MLEKIEIISTLLKEYDLIRLLFIGVGYLFIHKKISIVDKAVNQRPEGGKTISDEVSEINSKVDLISLDLTHVKAEVDLHRDVDEAAFLRIEKDIRLINSKL